MTRESMLQQMQRRCQRCLRAVRRFCVGVGATISSCNANLRGTRRRMCWSMLSRVACVSLTVTQKRRMLVQETTWVTWSPRRRPTHLPHNPLEIVSHALPVHRRRWIFSAKTKTHAPRDLAASHIARATLLWLELSHVSSYAQGLPCRTQLHEAQC